MKFLLALLFSAIGIAASAQVASPIVSSNSVTYQVISNATVTGSSVLVGTMKISSGALYGQVQNGGLIWTNGLTEIVQLSIDNVNFTPVMTNTEPVTNATIDTFSIPNATFPVYARFVLTGTNTATVGYTAAGATILKAPFVP